MGMLYLVPTPVGNLEDITLRALRVLKEADLVLAEDTRTSGLLLKHFEIKNQLVSHHKFNEHQTADAFAARMAAGEVMALISRGRQRSAVRDRMPRQTAPVSSPPGRATRRISWCASPYAGLQCACCAPSSGAKSPRRQTSRTAGPN